MAAYLIMIRDRMFDPAEFARYAQMAPAARTENLKPLAFYGAHQTLEGEPVDGVVLLEFPSMADATAWYDSPAYQEARAHRLKGADYRVVLVEGL